MARIVTINQAREIIPALLAFRSELAPNSPEHDPLREASLHAAINSVLGDGLDVEIRVSKGKDPRMGRLTMTKVADDPEG